MKSFAVLFHSDTLVDASAPQRRFDPRPRKIKQWLGHLPMADAAAAARYILAALHDLTGAKHDTLTLLAALESLREAAMQIADTLNDRLYTLCPPLPARSRAAADLARAIEHELASGYRQVLRDIYDTVALNKNKHCALVVQRIMKHKSRELLCFYARYTRVPEKQWRCLHECYTFADQHDLLRQPVLDPHQTGTGATSVLDTYRQIAVTASINPYRLLHGEAHRLYQWLEHRAHSVHLTPYVPMPNAPAGLLSIDLKQDCCPASKYQRLNELHARWLDCRPLLQEIEKTLLHGDDVQDVPMSAEPEARGASNARQNEPQTNAVLAEHFLKRIYLALSQTGVRRFSRTRCMQDVEMTIGLVRDVNSSTHTRTAGRMAREETVKDYNHTANAKMLSPLHGLRDSSTSSTSHAAHTPCWLKVEESAGGCRMLWQYASSTHARVGDVVVFDSPAPSSKSMVGVIRWLQLVDNYGLMMGLQLIAPYAERIALRHTVTEHSCNGLLLPALPNIGQSETLLVSPETASDPAWKLRAGKKESKVKLYKLLENTGIVAQYEFISLDFTDLTGEGTTGELAFEKPEPANETATVPESASWRLV